MEAHRAALWNTDIEAGGANFGVRKILNDVEQPDRYRC
jgi:hypothetical protein